jgi:hypothetical protein
MNPHSRKGFPQATHHPGQVVRRPERRMGRAVKQADGHHQVVEGGVGPVTDNGDLAVIEAEDLADGIVWKATDHYEGWYNGTPSGMKMLAGCDAIKPEQNRPAIRPVEIRQPGRHRLWIRLHTNDYADQFTVGLRQSGRTVAERTMSGRDAKFPR